MIVKNPAMHIHARVGERNMKKKIGIIQSRGLGDIIIALPIARYHWEQGAEIYWPICAEFISSVENSVPWVNWLSVETDPQGLFFFDTPVQMLLEQGIGPGNFLYLYQYLSNMPEMTDPELFNILKFDQYKYWVSGVPFVRKWTLSECIVRDLERERAFAQSLDLPEHYLVRHQTGSSARAEIDCSFLEKLAIIDVESHETDSIFDWISVLEGAAAFVGIDSVFANLVDGLCLDIPQKYWVRRSAWDLTPVLGSRWNLVSNPQGLTDPVRVNPVTAAEAKRARTQSSPLQVPQGFQGPASFPSAAGVQGQVVSNVPFESRQRYPTSFMSALRKP